MRDDTNIVSLRMKIKRLENEAKRKQSRLRHLQEKNASLSKDPTKIDFSSILLQAKKGVLNLNEATAAQYDQHRENLTCDQWIRLCIHFASSPERAVSQRLERKCVELEVRSEQYRTDAEKIISELKRENEVLKREITEMKEMTTKNIDAYESETRAERESRLKIMQEWETLRNTRSDADQRISILEQDKEFLKSEARSLSVHLKNLERRNASYDYDYHDDKVESNKNVNIKNENEDQKEDSTTRSLLQRLEATIPTPSDQSSLGNRRVMQRLEDERVKANSKVDALRMELESLRNKFDSTRDKELETQSAREYEIDFLPSIR